MKRLFYTIALFCALSFGTQAQESGKLTREQILSMTTEELSDLPLEQLMEAVETLGVKSVDELFALIMNKNVSSASKEEESSFTSPLSSTVITHDELRTYGVSTIEEALRLVPGMIVAEKLNGVYDVQMRGLNNIPDNNFLLYAESMNILVMIDGRVVHSYAIGTPNLDNLPISIEDIERLEVVRGATSALYGPNAVQGVINIITTKPDESRYVASGNVRAGDKNVQGEIALRHRFNSKFASGLTYNVNRRWRDNGELYLIPSANKYICYPGSGVEGGRAIPVSKTQLGLGLQNGTIKDVSGGAYINVDDLKYYYNVSAANDEGVMLSLSGIEDPSTQYKDPYMSRRNDGVNAYLTFTPANGIRLNLTGGYQYSSNLNTQVGQDNVGYRVREFSTAYVALDADIKDLKLLANYYGGCNHFCVGTPGFQMYQKLAQVSAEYTFHLGDLALKPAVGYKKMYIEDHKPEFIDYGDGKGAVETSGFLGYRSEGNISAENDDFEASLRLDYKRDGLRLVGAGRIDKTSIPDDLNPSWQFVASYQINDRNFVRVNYGHARRSTVFFHSSSNYNWHNSGVPNYIQFLGNEESPLVKIDNFEFGYRIKPTRNLLVDFESFYSISSDYGVLKAHSAMLTLASKDLNGLLGQVMGALQTDPSQLPALLGTASAAMADVLGTKAFVRYGSMPFTVYQKGLGLNVDWIISPKLIAKFNVNAQQTKIDDYYVYEQTDMFVKQFADCQVKLAGDGQSNLGLIQDIVGRVVGTAMQGGNPQDVLDACLGYTPISAFADKYKKMSDADKAAFEQQLLAMYQSNETAPGIDRPLGLYYALKYGVRYSNDIKQEYYIGADDVDNPGDHKENRKDNFKHKATPSVYGSVGFIFRPMDKLSFSTMGYFAGKRNIDSTFGQEVVDGFFTMNLRAAYRLKECAEFFVEGHNLFSSNKRQFAYTDKMKPMFSFGVNFGFGRN